MKGACTHHCIRTERDGHRVQVPHPGSREQGGTIGSKSSLGKSLREEAVSGKSVKQRRYWMLVGGGVWKVEGAKVNLEEQEGYTAGSQ